MVDRVFDSAGTVVIVEERLAGREVTLVLLSDGLSFKILGFVRDYKTLHNFDQGPNTGGMSSYYPVLLSTTIIESMEKTIVKPTIDGMNSEGIRTLPVC